MNKGLKIWTEKHKKQKRQAATKKPEQVGVVCFANFRDVVHHKVNGKYVHPEIVKRKGLQVENRFYYVAQSEIKNCAINRHGAKVTKFFCGIPEWADMQLIEKYNRMREKFLNEGILKEVAEISISEEDDDGSNKN